MISPPLQDTRFRLTEDQATELASRFGTPLYVVDEKHFRERVRSYLNAFRSAYPKSEISFASKANSTGALMKIAYLEGCSIDVASEGELRVALAAGVPASRCHLHGNNKSRAELEFAIEQGVAHIVVDHFGEIETIAELSRPGKSPKLVIRLAPGVDPITHHKISTGQADTKFGFNIADGSAEKATQRCLELGLNLIGFHCHVGSQLLDPEAQRSGGELITQFAVDMLQKHGFKSEYLNVGGGLGIAYTDGDEPMPVDEYCRLVAQAVTGALAGSGLDPVLGQEPGRALVGESGLTLYRVGVVKTVPAKTIGQRTYVVVDGGLSDNPRPALYGSKYTVERVSPAAAGPVHRVTISGRHCETDRLFEDVDLPHDAHVGDLLQVLCTGAYNSSMASNYNRFQRPATVLIRESGDFELIQRRESWDEMLSREILPKDLGG
ncbi:MAG TPA: diaminopimelate decarboxylase [Fimbriimonas sp.]|nr:diaminopimelate decarboxylase [Fimbriimonas sp.]